MLILGALLRNDPRSGLLHRSVGRLFQSLAFLFCENLLWIMLFDFAVVYFPFLDGDVPSRASYGVHFSNLLCLLESAIMLRTSSREINI